MDDPTLDPADWDTLRAHAHDLLDRSLDRLQTARDGRVWTPLPDVMKDALRADLPSTGIGHGALAEKLAGLLPYGVGNTHPRFFGWVHGAGNPGGVMAEIVAAAMNANLGGRDHGAIYVEKQVLDWCRAMMGFPADCGGLIVSGTSMATIIALKAARDRRLEFASRANGVGQARLTGYASTQAHSCVARAFDMLGLGSDALRPVPCLSDFTMDITALRRMIAEDADAGLTPFAVIGTAGSVNVGAIDDLAGIADIAAAKDLWFHVDGAFGATAILSDLVRPRLRGMDRADSLAFDFHKWLHVNYDAGCVLIRDRDAHLRAFSERPDYLAPAARGLAAGNPWPVDFGPELSRSFRALKIWAHFLEHGTDKLGAAITRNVEQAAWLGQRVDDTPGLELLAPATLNIVCLRYAPEGTKDPDTLNEAIVIELQESGAAAPSTTRINGKLAIRVNLTNHRTTRPDLDLLLSEVLRLGKDLAQA
ncbi:MAG: pyridoxal-dependent decarboxylase [Paracoccaceae bacterium]